MRFLFRGWFMKKGKKYKFTKELEAESEKLAIEKLFSLLGSNHKVKRRHIHVESVEKA